MASKTLFSATTISAHSEVPAADPRFFWHILHSHFATFADHPQCNSDTVAGISDIQFSNGTIEPLQQRQNDAALHFFMAQTP